MLLRTFITVADTGSISAAARQLHATQGGVSQQIKRLETFFNCTLLERDVRGSQLTQEGNRLIKHARRLLESNDDLCREMFGATQPENVRIGIPYDMAGAHSLPIIKTYAQRYPAVEIEIINGSSVELMQDYHKGALDLTISQCPLDEAVDEVLMVDRLVWIGPQSDIFCQRPLPLCFVTPTCTFRRTVFEMLNKANINWKTIFENASVETTLSTVRGQLAITPWLRSLIPQDLHELENKSALPLLPNYAIQLNVPKDARLAVLNMAEIIRSHYSLSKTFNAPL